MAQPMGNNYIQLTLEQAREAIKDAVAAFSIPENAQKMKQAKEDAGTDMMKVMQFVLPLAVQIQQSVIQKYGFESNQTGVMQFAMAVAVHKADPEIAALSAQLKELYMPKVNFQMPQM